MAKTTTTTPARGRSRSRGPDSAPGRSATPSKRGASSAPKASDASSSSSGGGPTMLNTLLFAACLQLIFFAGTLSWFSETLPWILKSVGASTVRLEESTLPSGVSSSVVEAEETFLSYLPRALMAAGSHTSSFTVGCIVALIIRRLVPRLTKTVKESMLMCIAALIASVAFYFLLCYLWFSAIVPAILDPRLFSENFREAKRATLSFDAVSKDTTDHYLVAAGSHTFCWLAGVLAVLGQVATVSRKNIEKLTVLTALFSVIVVGTQMKPGFIILAILVCIVVLAVLRNRGERSQFNACVVGAAVVGLASCLSKYDFVIQVNDGVLASCVSKYGFVFQANGGSAEDLRAALVGMASCLPNFEFEIQVNDGVLASCASKYGFAVQANENGTDYFRAAFVGLASCLPKYDLLGANLLPNNQAIMPLMRLWLEEAKKPNLPFCEAPFAMTRFAAQGASALAHMPFVPAILLGFSGVSPETIATLNPADEKHGKNARELKMMLWLQFALQTITGVLGHVLPNPRVVLNQEVSIILAFSLLFVIIKQSTPAHLHNIDWKVSTFLTLFPVVGYLTIGLMPVIFTSFIAAMCIGSTIKGAFGLFTPHANNILMATFIPTILILGAETAGCVWLQANISKTFPFHLLFDLLFWQVVGSALDIVFITPRPGKYMYDDKKGK